MRFCSIVGQASIHTARASGPSTMERSSGLLPPLGIQAPGPRPGGGDIEPNKAEHDGGMPLVQHRPKALRRVAQEIRDGHLAAGKANSLAIPNCMKRKAVTIRRTLSK